MFVLEMRVKFVKALEDTVAHQNGLVTLRCELNKLRGDVLWLKDGVEIMPSRRFTIRANGPERTLTIHRLIPADAGEYACESKDDRTCGRLVVKSKRASSITGTHSMVVLVFNKFSVITRKKGVQNTQVTTGFAVLP